MYGFTAVGYFLVSILFGLIILALWMRLSLRYLRISHLTPFAELVHSLTDPIINPMITLFKYSYKPGQRYDWMAFAVLIIVELIKIISLSLLAFHTLMPIVFLILYVLADLIIQPCNLLFYAILIRVIMSYVNPAWNNPAAHYLRLVTEPLLIRAKRMIPELSGFDISSIVTMIALKVITLFISASLPWRIL